MNQMNAKTIYEVLGRNSVHPFPARMAPGVVRELVANPGARKRLRVLDPMMGSGTVLALARARGHQAYGVDIDPLAVLIAKVWTTSIDRSEVRQKAQAVLVRAKRTFSSLSLKQAYPHHADWETRKFVRYWFDGYSRRQVAALALSIRNVRDEAVRNVLWCAFSRLIITKQAGVSLAQDLAHSRPHRAFDVAPIKPFSNFLRAVERVLQNCIPKTGLARGPAPSIRRGDARFLELADNTVDLVLTSPPYMNAIDYLRCSKFSLVWMGCSTEDVRQVRSASIGTEVGNYGAGEFVDHLIRSQKLHKRLSRRHRAMLSRFIVDMVAALTEVARVLVPGGNAVYIIGENSVRGTFIRNSSILTAIAQYVGLTFCRKSTRALPPNRRYLPPPSRRNKDSLDVRMRREVVLHFRKPRAGLRPMSNQSCRTIGS
jgi:DNA modification methylase